MSIIPYLMTGINLGMALIWIIKGSRWECVAINTAAAVICGGIGYAISRSQRRIKLLREQDDA